MLLSDTSVPDVFIVCHMQELTGDTLKFCLWLMMTYGTAGKFTLESVKDYSYLNPSEASEAIAELIAAGLVYKSGDDSFCLTDLKQKEALDFAKAYAAKGVNIDGLELSADAKARDVLAASISKTFVSWSMGAVKTSVRITPFEVSASRPSHIRPASWRMARMHSETRSTLPTPPWKETP